MDSMLHNVNLLNWKQARKRTAILRNAVVVIGLTVLSLMIVVGTCQPIYYRYLDSRYHAETLSRLSDDLSRQQQVLIERERQQLHRLKQQAISERQRFIRLANVTLMTLLSRTLAEGVYLDHVELAGLNARLGGFFYQSAHFNTFVAALGADPDVKSVALIQVMASPHDKRRPLTYIFQLRVVLDGNRRTEGN